MGGIVAGETSDIHCFMASLFPGWATPGIDGLAWGNRETMKP
jgi:hypothetical protein